MTGIEKFFVVLGLLYGFDAFMSSLWEVLAAR